VNLRAILLLCLVPALAPADSFTLTVGSYQKGSSPIHAHTWLVMVRTTDDSQQERLCVSWMTASDRVRLLHGPDSGENWSEARTLEWAEKIGAKVTTWGPYPATVGLWNRACVQTYALASGRVGYVALDGRYRPGATNCIHAVSDITGWRLNTGLAYGERASLMVLDHLLRTMR